MNNREFLRVEVPELRVHYNEIPENSSIPHFLGFVGKGEMSSGLEPEGCDPVQEMMLRMVRRVEFKLDRILGHLERDGYRPSYEFQGQVVDISGGGLSFATVNDHAVGAVLELCIFPQFGDPRPLFAIGKICWIEPSSSDVYPAASLVGVKFVEIEEEAREAIIRLVFQMERKRKQRDVEEGRNPGGKT